MAEFRIDQATPGTGTAGRSRHDLVPGEVITLVATGPIGASVTYSWEILDKVGSVAVLDVTTGSSVEIGAAVDITQPCAFLVELTANNGGVITKDRRICSVRTANRALRVPVFPETAPITNRYNANDPDLSTDNASYSDLSGLGASGQNFRGWAEWAYELVLAVEEGGGGGGFLVYDPAGTPSSTVFTSIYDAIEAANDIDGRVRILMRDSATITNTPNLNLGDVGFVSDDPSEGHTLTTTGTTTFTSFPFELDSVSLSHSGSANLYTGAIYLLVLRGSARIVALGATHVIVGSGSIVLKDASLLHSVSSGSAWSIPAAGSGDLNLNDAALITNFGGGATGVVLGGAGASIDIVQNSAVAWEVASIDVPTVILRENTPWPYVDGSIVASTSLSRHAKDQLVVRPAQITADQDDYEDGLSVSADVLYLSSDTTRAITGFVVGTQENTRSQKLVINDGGSDLSFPHDNIGSAAAYRFLTSDGAPVTLSQNESMMCVYDWTAQRHRLFKFGGGGGSDTVTTLTDAATIVVDASLGPKYEVTITDNRTFGAPINDVAGQDIQIVIFQDGTGGRTLTFHTDWVNCGKRYQPARAPNSASLLRAAARGSPSVKWYFTLEHNEHTVVPTAQITANQTAWNPTGKGYADLIVGSTNASTRELQGIQAPSSAEQKSFRFVLTGAFNLVIKHQNGSAGALDRITTQTAGDLLIQPNDTLEFVYETENGVWRLF